MGGLSTLASCCGATRTPLDHIAAGRPQCMMGTGALPLETPPENIRRIRAYLA
ncbi:MAG: hypothetical protein ACYC35_29850 [Pirellulales bacterium]